jgi:Ca-activated chloride channel family protein
VTLDTEASPFTLEAYYTPTLPESGDHLTVIMSVEAAHIDLMTAPQDRVLVFIIDKSGSMQGASIDAVRQAVMRGIDLCDSEMTIAVVVFDEMASVLVRPQKADEHGKQDAMRYLQMLYAGGGTAFSTGLDLARQICQQYPNAIRRAIFLTDGVERDRTTGSLRTGLAQLCRRIRVRLLGTRNQVARR